MLHSGHWSSTLGRLPPNMANFGRPILHETNLQKVQWSTFNTTSMKSMGIAPPRHQRPRLEGEWSTRICANLDVSSSGEMGGWVGDHREGGNIEGMSSTWLPQGSKRRKVVEFVKKVMSSSLRQSQSERRSRYWHFQHLMHPVFLDYPNCTLYLVSRYTLSVSSPPKCSLPVIKARYQTKL